MNTYERDSSYCFVFTNLHATYFRPLHCATDKTKLVSADS